MARDRLLPRGLAAINARTGTPIRITWVTAVIVGILAGLIPLDQIAALANAGTLLAFMAVALCMLVLRRSAPDRIRPFRTKAAWIVGPMAILGCLYLFASLPSRTQLFFACWNLVGLGIYAGRLNCLKKLF
jgi:APA family basic amino acid/polyamine antiporter